MTSLAMQLSQELLDKIIDDLRYDRKALGACSLVSRHWCPRSQMHLFVNFRIHIGTHKAQLRFFVENPTFVSYVKKLSVGVAGRHTAWSAPEEVPDVVFPHATTLELLVDWRRQGPALERYIQQYFPPLTSLSLGRDIKFDTFSPLLSIIEGCPQLKYLSLLCGVKKKVQEPFAGGAYTLHLDELEIWVGFNYQPSVLAEEFGKWVGENAGDRVRVGHLTVFWHQYPGKRQGDLDIVQGLLDALSMSLEGLKVVYYPDNHRSQYDPKISLAKCSELESLHIDLGATIGASTDLAWVVQMIASTSCKSIRITVSCPFNEFKHIPWIRFHEAIVLRASGGHGRALDSFVLDLLVAHRRSAPLEAIAEVVESGMPLLKGKVEYAYH